MKKEVYEKWDIFEELTTEEDIDAFLKASIEMAKDDTDPIYLRDAVETAAKARELLKAKRKSEADVAADIQEEYGSSDNPPVGVFDKAARSFG